MRWKLPDLRTLAGALDARARAGDQAAAEALRPILEGLALHADGLFWRYIPGGVFRMGSPNGEPDEQPVHDVHLGDFWMLDAPMSWWDHCRLMGWHAPPSGLPTEPPTEKHAHFQLHNDNKIRLQYCEDKTVAAGDWHAHAPERAWELNGKPVSAAELFGEPNRTDRSPFSYATKPMIAVSWEMADDLVKRLAATGSSVDLPTEAQWERAARGGMDGCRYPWGDDDPTPETCDFDAFALFRIRPSRSLPPNAYGLYGMSGGVSEWCKDHYRADWYAHRRARDPVCLVDDPAAERVLRGGSWADCAEAVTVSFRGARGSGRASPNVGYRLVRRG